MLETVEGLLMPADVRLFHLLVMALNLLYSLFVASRTGMTRAVNRHRSNGRQQVNGNGKVKSVPFDALDGLLMASDVRAFLCRVPRIAYLR